MLCLRISSPIESPTGIIIYCNVPATRNGHWIAFELWEAIDEFHNLLNGDGAEEQLGDEGPTVAIDRLSDVLKSIEADISETIRVVGPKKNELMADPVDVQRVAALEAVRHC